MNPLPTTPSGFQKTSTRGTMDAMSTVAAVATPPGRGGVAIVRISGPLAKDALHRLFLPCHPNFQEFQPHRLHHGHIQDLEGQILDEVLAVFMPGPASFTGEDTAEIHCHGGQAIPAAVLEATLAVGCETAAPGEFTKRAFLNGRLDLTQAEAVAEMIAAPTKAGTGLALAKLEGALGRKVGELKGSLEYLRVQLCVAVDFPEEEIECLAPEDFLTAVEEIAEDIRSLLAGHERTRCWREGALVVLAGRVNAGKSSLLNTLLGRERAIVTATPGATRDYLEESLVLDGLPVRLVDTAGLRNSGEIVQDEAELQGLAASRDLALQADLVVLVTDTTQPQGHPEQELVAHLDRDRLLLAENKYDLRPEGITTAPAQPLSLPKEDILQVSAKTGQGIDQLTQRIRDKIVTRLTGGHGEPEKGELVPNLRQSQALTRALKELEELAEDIRNQTPYDLAGVRLETTCAILAEITGEITSAEVLDSIFESFCIGK